jgi:lipoate-protein ligase A
MEKARSLQFSNCKLEIANLDWEISSVHGQFGSSVMYRLDLTLATPAENLALDEALLDSAEDSAGTEGAEVLRLWEPSEPFVVVGRSSRIADEVNVRSCNQRGVPILRRSSGGAAVVTGPGCLMYAIVPCYERHPDLRAIDRAHAFVLERIAGALRPHVPTVRCAGTSDLVLAGGGILGGESRKFSGNSMRSRRMHFLYHGTVLYDFDLSLISSSLLMPPRQPKYRLARQHDRFVTNLPLAGQSVREAIAGTWQADEKLSDWPKRRTEVLVEEKYGREQWNVLL